MFCTQRRLAMSKHQTCRPRLTFKHNSFTVSSPATYTFLTAKKHAILTSSAPDDHKSSRIYPPPPSSAPLILSPCSHATHLQIRLDLPPPLHHPRQHLRTLRHHSVQQPLCSIRIFVVVGGGRGWKGFYEIEDGGEVGEDEAGKGEVRFGCGGGFAVTRDMRAGQFGTEVCDWQRKVGLLSSVRELLHRHMLIQYHRGVLQRRQD